MYGKELNIHRFNRPLNTALCSALNPGMGNKTYAWNEYEQKGLLFQIDCNYGVSGTTWKDIIDKAKSATISGTYTTDDGVVLASGASVSFPDVSGVAYVEICTKVDDTFATSTATSLETYSTAGSIYSVRAYSSELTDAQKAKNAAIDENRFNIPNGSLADADGYVVLDASGSYIVMQ